ncbi:MAG: hypothetical protein AUG51_01610 [Acidobacteria bacterium 13_1_20CM_3_53_8]|nr:MAG: hypothetical protein AUG51_01610 [Acidobacteria bacterium 13_1_20CM_3_53_8]
MRKKPCAFALLLLLATACAKSPDNQTTVTSQQQTTQVTTNSQIVNANAQPTAANTNSAQTTKQLDACSLLTTDEVAQVQGDQVGDAKSSSSAQGDFLVSQCFYTTNNFANSVSLSLAEPDPTKVGAPGPRKFWETTFHRAGQNGSEQEHERERERGRKKQSQSNEQEQTRRNEGEEEESVPPKKIAGLGDEAYWSANAVGGVLYVLKKNSFLRISVGSGPGDNDARIRKCKALAQKALKRMP